MDKGQDQKIIENVRNAYSTVMNELTKYKQDCPCNRLPVDKINNLLGEWVNNLVENRWEDNFESYGAAVKRELTDISNHLYEFKKVIDSYIYKLDSFNFRL